ncbi:MAG: hypothetical protein ACE3JQ_01585 [Paenisporosarcina sp.]
MNNLYVAIIFIHVISAVISVGPLFVLFPVLHKMRGADSHIEKAYISVFRSVVRLIKHAGHVLVGSGILLIIYGPWSWFTPWIVLTITLMVISIFFLARAFSPTLKKFEEPYPDKFLLVNQLHKSTWIYIILLVLMLGLMVIKPDLW